MYPPSSPFFFLVVLAGCSGGKGGGDYTFVDDADVEVAVNAAVAPLSVYVLSALMLAFQKDPACPTITETDTTYQVVGGGCTDSSGVTWSGTFQVAQTAGTATITLTGWSILSDGFAYGGDGVLLATTSGEDLTGLSSTDFTATVTDFPELVYSSYDLSGDLSSSFFGGTGTATTAAEVSADGEGFTLAGSQTHTVCPDEPDSGTLTATGSNVLTLTFDGESACDGCTPWTTDDGGSGSYCEEDGDTGR